jgi:hypothetical protein
LKGVIAPCESSDLKRELIGNRYIYKCGTCAIEIESDRSKARLKRKCDLDEHWALNLPFESAAEALRWASPVRGVSKKKSMAA